MTNQPDLFLDICRNRQEAQEAGWKTFSQRALNPIARLNQLSQGSQARICKMVFAYLMNLEQLNKAIGIKQHYTSTLHDFMDAEEKWLKQLTHPEGK